MSSPDSALGQRLAARTLELVDIPSPSRDEARIAESVAALVPQGRLTLSVEQEETLLYLPRARREERPLVVLAGHFDTVPAQGNIPGRLEEDAVWGLGASDMKSGLAVMVELARTLAQERDEPAVDLGLLFFAREELPASESPLPALFARMPDLGGAGLVVMMEPTDNTIQAGCLGNLDATLVFTGESAHSARPWLGVNAIERAIAGLRPIVAIEPRPVEIGGLTFVEVVSLTGIEGGLAGNVIPDRVSCRLNFRYAPDRSPADAEAQLERLAAEAHADAIELIGNSPPARVVTDAPLVTRLREAGGFALEPKQAWTPVADFTSRGLDAVNLGPGATRYAHRRDEQVAVPELVRTFRALERFLGASV